MHPLLGAGGEHEVRGRLRTIPPGVRLKFSSWWIGIFVSERARCTGILRRLSVSGQIACLSEWAPEAQRLVDCRVDLDQYKPTGRNLVPVLMGVFVPCIAVSLPMRFCPKKHTQSHIWMLQPNKLPRTSRIQPFLSPSPSSPPPHTARCFISEMRHRPAPTKRNQGAKQNRSSPEHSRCTNWHGPVQTLFELELVI